LSANRWPFGVAFCIWILGEIGSMHQAPRRMLAWWDVAEAARSGLPGWRVLVVWGPGSRWLQDAAAARQRFADGCGAAVLQELLRSHGIALPQTLLWNLTRLPTGGTTLQRMAHVASRFGVVCHVRHLPRLAALQPMARDVPAPVVLHLKRAHFVVLLQQAEPHALVLDPSLGRVRVRRESLWQRASGLALSCDAARRDDATTRRPRAGERVP
jgi:predicted double-glycine peptidase